MIKKIWYFNEDCHVLNHNQSAGFAKNGHEKTTSYLHDYTHTQNKQMVVYVLKIIVSVVSTT